MRHIAREHLSSASQSQSATMNQADDWQQELLAWGINEPEQNARHPDLFELWAEHKNAVEWWLSIPDFLRFHQRVCLGMNVVAVNADAALSGRAIYQPDYHKLKLIARTLSEELNRHGQ